MLRQHLDRAESLCLANRRVFLYTDFQKNWRINGLIIEWFPQQSAIRQVFLIIMDWYVLLFSFCGKIGQNVELRKADQRKGFFGNGEIILPIRIQSLFKPALDNSKVGGLK